MGYTHYWRREKEIKFDKMISIVDDFKRVIPEIEKAGVMLADGHGVGEPVIAYYGVVFNGAVKCGHPQNAAISIPWPSKDAGGVANPWKENAQSGHWFAGAEIQKRVCNGDCSYETFIFPRIMEISAGYDPDKEGRYFDCTKTAFRPYDIAVTAFLVIAKHHLGDHIKVSSDGEDGHWFDGKMLCQMVLGYGLEYCITEKGLTKEVSDVTKR
jgi:hypothetical protein